MIKNERMNIWMQEPNRLFLILAKTRKPIMSKAKISSQFRKHDF